MWSVRQRGGGVVGGEEGLCHLEDFLQQRVHVFKLVQRQLPTPTQKSHSVVNLSGAR